MNIDKLLTVYYEETQEQISALERGLLDLERAPDNRELVNDVFRSAHTIKGSSGTMASTLGLEKLRSLTGFMHGMEETLDLMRKEKLSADRQSITALLDATDLIREMVAAYKVDSSVDPARIAEVTRRMDGLRPELRGKETPVGLAAELTKPGSARQAASTTIRIELHKLDHLINAVGEMSIAHSMIAEAVRSGGAATPQTEAALAQLQRIGRDIQESALSLRMLPVGDVFQRFARPVRELAEAQGKIVALRVDGEDTELDKGVLEKIADPLMHVIRNAVDHGIERPAERMAAGKPAAGAISLSAYAQGDSVHIEIRDDGRGLLREHILRKALSQGIIPSGDGLTDEQVHELLFIPGFSTAEAVTDVSGRGVGLDVVKKNIDTLKGRVTLRADPGRGTTVSIKLPLTLAIMDGLTVRVGGETFVIPVASVRESLRPGRDHVKTLNERGEMVRVRGEYLRLIRLHELFGISALRPHPSDGVVVVAEHEGRRRCLLVDELLGEQQVAIKNLGAVASRVRDVVGGAILGDGRVALVLDVPAVMARAET